ncbi:anaerobic ribonucleoside-triphosphate reductase [Candidatus Woesearchaeota archaeon]|nr:anaerobic ribonucleoside-triphosphate reductase [Candidatus Woesearchaeota archaeon]MBW3021692.1 anaerobic ribonucleoside-triphosphate reductase [Candidatus Woesearchaeota archaeon]
MEVIKSDNRREEFSEQKLAHAIERTGIPDEHIDRVVGNIKKRVYNLIPTSELRKLVIEELDTIDEKYSYGFKYKKNNVWVVGGEPPFNHVFQPFMKQRIVESLIKETAMEENLARDISDEVEHLLIENKIEHISGPLIRELVNYILTKNKLFKYKREYSRLGIPVYDVDKTINQNMHENANLGYHAEAIHKLIADNVSKQFALTKLLPPELAYTHLKGELYIHDLSYFATRPFCFASDLRFFFQNGLKVDGFGNQTSTAGPAKHADVALNHAAKIVGAGQTNCAGGQGLDFFNIWMAPFLKGLSYDRIKQLAQQFIYEMNMMLVSRGGQAVFSSISLEFDPPKWIAELPAVLPGGKVSERETYADYTDEALTFIKALTEVFLQGDYHGKMFSWPKPEYKVRKPLLNGKHEELFGTVHQLASKFGSPYFLNLTAPYMPDICQSQCCRFFLTPSADEWKDIERGSTRSSCIQYVSLNLPRVAYEVKNETQAFELIDQRMEQTKEIFKIKNDIVRRRLDQKILPFLAQDCYGEYLYPINHCLHNFGFVGLNEMVKSLTGEELHESESAWKFGLKVIKHMSDKSKVFNEDKEAGYGLRYGVVQTPGESAPHRLAKIDLRDFKERAVVQGNVNDGSVYYMNSSHPNYSANINLFKRLQLDASFHPLLDGGAISHVFLGESNPDPSALLKLTRKICDKTLTAYYAYTKDISYCIKCHKTFGGIYELCPNCGAKEVECYSRVTGYYQRVSGWNKGKKQEFLDRKRYGSGL